MSLMKENLRLIFDKVNFIQNSQLDHVLIKKQEQKIETGSRM